jgi:hypothetical protein
VKLTKPLTALLDAYLAIESLFDSRFVSASTRQKLQEVMLLLNQEVEIQVDQQREESREHTTSD